MQLEHEFSVPVPVAQAWDVLLDVERIAPCMPGATVESFDGETIVGRVKVKVGPIQVTYAGTARFSEKDRVGLARRDRGQRQGGPGQRHRQRHHHRAAARRRRLRHQRHGRRPTWPSPGSRRSSAGASWSRSATSCSAGSPTASRVSSAVLPRGLRPRPRGAGRRRRVGRRGVDHRDTDAAGPAGTVADADPTHRERGDRPARHRRSTGAEAAGTGARRAARRAGALEAGRATPLTTAVRR